ncbi:MAG: type II secretion system secretin GspD [Desulfobacterales bacterium]|jgi:general secretion pathway protein D
MKWSTPFFLLCLLLTPTAVPPVSATGEVSGAPEPERLVTLDLNNVDITVFIQFVGELTGKNFIVDRRVRGNVTVIAPRRIPVSDMYRVFESVLQTHGFSAVAAGQVVKIVPSTEARTMNIDTGPVPAQKTSGDELVTRIISLTYADADELKRLLTPLVSRNAVIGAIADANQLIVTDTTASIRRLMRIIREVDIADNRRELTIFPLEYANGSKLAELLTTLFPSLAPSKRGRPTKTATATFVADERTNSLVVIAPKAEISRIKDLIYLLDGQVLREKGKLRVYYLKNARAEELAKILQDLPAKGTAAQPVKGARPILTATTGVYADAATNSLILSAESEEELQTLEDVIARLDGPRAMVYVEVLIMEVNAQDDLRIGVEWTAVGETQIGGKEAAVGGGFVQAPQDSALPGFVNGTFPNGFAVGVFTEAIDIAGVQFNNLTALLQAVKEERDVNVISTPQILITDQEEAKINVGKNIPFQTRTSSSFDQTYLSFEYRDVGTTLKVTPQISDNDSVRLNIGLEVSLLESTTDFKPTTLVRTIDTSVLVKDSGTVVIGGLIENSPARSENKVPLLGDIPLLGWLFKEKTQSRQKTNLLVFLTPRVLKTTADAARLSQENEARFGMLQKGAFQTLKVPPGQ